jgi:hypothetical protein
MNKGIVRAHNKKPFSKSTEEETERRVQRTEELLRTGPILKHELIKILKREFKVDWRMCNHYIARARERLLLHIQRAKEELRADSVAWWEGNILDKKAPYVIKQNARRQMDRILGLEILQLEHSGKIITTGVDIETLDLDTPTLEKLLEAIRKKNGTASGK